MTSIDLSENTVDEVKKFLEENDEVNYSKLLSKEKSGKDRKTVKRALKREIEGADLQKAGNGEDIADKMQQIAEDFRNGGKLEDLISRINQGVREDVNVDGKTVKPVQEEKNSVENFEQQNRNLERLDRDEEFEERVSKYSDLFESIRDEIGGVVIGQEAVIKRILVALICDGHVLMEGVPGLGKSLSVETLGRTISDVEFNRVQFVSDMLPSDIMGQRVYNQKTGEFYVNKGPVFTNLLLADEINRAPPKTQAALMEVMQEEKVSIDKKEFELEKPYIVLATQNPLEQKGTYTLPKAIIDRFFMKLLLDYPEPENEEKIIERNTIRERNVLEEVEEVLDCDEILQAQEDVRDIFVSPEVRRYIVKIVSVARGKSDLDIESAEFIDYGPSPRASVWLAMGASAKAMISGRTYVVPEDVKEIAKPVLRHRIILNYQGEISDMETDDVIEEILNVVDPL